MDEMQTLGEFRADAPAADRARLAPGHERLLAEQGRKPRFRGNWKLTALGAAAAVAAAAVLSTQLGPDPAPPRPQTGTEAVSQPRDGQWIYRKVVEWQAPLNFVNDLNPTTDDRAGRPDGWTHESESWTQYGSGKLMRTLPQSKQIDRHGITTANGGSPKALRGRIAKLPDEPAALFRALSTIFPLGSGGAAEQSLVDSANYHRVVMAFTEVDEIPPKVRESLFRVLGTLSGVTVSKQPVEDAAGRPALAVYETVTDTSRSLNLRRELLIDPTTHTYLGERTLYLAGGKLDGKVTTKDTLVRRSALVANKVVDNHSLRS
ncbi:hypothetical protein [Streptomyces sp. NBC_00306]|uniref:hypothetical protein n=1 Tax=Streptomyces sp. NBC_00306 TaxID=2975708 RepID=UPI002E2AD8D6|nr:hypothetical protein [Streptomyces sp. NBC_00306]